MLNLSIAAIIISEIAWMGTTASPNDEWIELYNNTGFSVNLNNWVLKSVDDTPKIKLTGVILPNGFYLLERTDDTTLPNIIADQIYTGALGNTGENLELYDGSGILIDRVDNSNGWTAGDNSTKQTMERAGHQSWQTSQNPGGTPKEKNSEKAPVEVILQQEPQSTTTTVEVRPQQREVEPQSVVEPKQPVVYPSGIILSEIMPSPEGPDETEEWIKIFNKNNFEVDLSDWQITDTIGKTNTYTFPAGIKISAMGFLVLNRPETKIILNNNADGLKLIQPDEKTIDSVNYEKAPQGQSYNLTNSGWIWSGNKGDKKEENKIEKSLAAISEPIIIGQNKRNFSPLLTAITLAILSGFVIILLILKHVRTQPRENN